MKEHPVKRTLTFIGSMVLIAALAGSPVAVAQETAKPLVPLKVQLVVSRYAADKKISSLPYTLWVTANDKRTTSVRMGVQVPIVTTSSRGKDGGARHRHINTRISARTSTARPRARPMDPSVSTSD